MSTQTSSGAEVPVIVIVKDPAEDPPKPLPPVLPCFSPEGTTVEYMTTDDEGEEEDDVLNLTDPDLNAFIKKMSMDNTPCLKPKVLHSGPVQPSGSKKKGSSRASSKTTAPTAKAKTSAAPASEVSEAMTSGTPPGKVSIPSVFEATLKTIATKSPIEQVKYKKRLLDLLASAPKMPSRYSSFKCPPKFEIKSTFSFDLFSKSHEAVKTPDESMEVEKDQPGPSDVSKTVSAAVSIGVPSKPNADTSKGSKRDENRSKPRDRIKPLYVKSPGRARPVKERLGTRPVGLDASLVLPIQGSVSQAELLRLNGIELAGKLRTARRRQSRTRNRMRHRGVPESDLHYRYIWSKSAPKGGES